MAQTNVAESDKQLKDVKFSYLLTTFYTNYFFNAVALLFL